jgi:hypothetical protein
MASLKPVPVEQYRRRRWLRLVDTTLGAQPAETPRRSTVARSRFASLRLALALCRQVRSPASAVFTLRITARRLAYYFNHHLPIIG